MRAAVDAPPPSVPNPLVDFQVQPSLRALLSQRYAEPTEPGDAGQTEHGTVPPLLPLLLHRCVRRFRREPLPSRALELLVAAAQSASSSSHLQLWSVIDVQHAEARRALYEVAGAAAAPHRRWRAQLFGTTFGLPSLP